jgi:uncharacterized membrane protein
MVCGCAANFSTISLQLSFGVRPTQSGRSLMTSALLLEVLHVATAMLFVAGLIGRSATFQRAGQARDIQTAATLLSLSEWFERNFVIPAYFAVLMTGLLVAWLARWPIWTGLTSGTPKWPLVSLVVFLSPMTFILSYLAPRRKRRAQALADALSQEKVTPALAAALHDRGVLLFRRVEFFLTGVVTVLMVTKPF